MYMPMKILHKHFTFHLARHFLSSFYVLLFFLSYFSSFDWSYFCPFKIFIIKLTSLQRLFLSMFFFFHYFLFLMQWPQGHINFLPPPHPLCLFFCLHNVLYFCFCILFWLVLHFLFTSLFWLTLFTFKTSSTSKNN